MTRSWPEEPAPAIRREWRDTIRNAADFALLGVLTTVASLPLVTAGAAVATASAAVHDWSETQTFPGAPTCWRRFRRGLLPGLGAVLVAAAGVWLLALDLAALHAGRVPGGTPLYAATAVLAAIGVGVAALTVVHVGRRGGTGWVASVRAVVGSIGRRPWAVLAATAVVALTAAVGVMVLPVLIPVLVGYALLALHAVAHRLHG
jgi:hypothetical protein